MPTLLPTVCRRPHASSQAAIIFISVFYEFSPMKFAVRIPTSSWQPELTDQPGFFLPIGGAVCVHFKHFANPSLSLFLPGQTPNFSIDASASPSASASMVAAGAAGKPNSSRLKPILYFRYTVVRIFQIGNP